MQKSAALLALLPLLGLALVATSEAEGPLALRMGPLELEVELGEAAAPAPARFPRVLTQEQVLLLDEDGEGTLPHAAWPRALFVPGPDGGWTVVPRAAVSAS